MTSQFIALILNALVMQRVGHDSATEKNDKTNFNLTLHSCLRAPAAYQEQYVVGFVVIIMVLANIF